MDQLDNNISTPLYKQLEDILKKAIEDGTLRSGTRLPTEAELSAQYNVSRITVRKALSTLSQNRLLERKSGKGTFVAERKIQRNISGVLSFTEMCRMLGYEPGAKTIKLAIEDPNEDDIKQMKLASNEKIIAVERIRSVNGTPISIEMTKLPEEFFFLINENLDNTSLYELLSSKFGIVFTNSVKTIEIVFANYKESRYLSIPTGYPLLCISSVISDAEGKHLHLSRQLSVADKYKLMV